MPRVRSYQGTDNHPSPLKELKDGIRSRVHIDFHGNVHKHFRGTDADKRCENEARILRALEERGCPYVPRLLEHHPEDDMAAFAIELSNDRIELVDGVDAYQQEGPLTTFFAVESQRLVIDSWSTRVASFRTADIVTVRRT